MESEDGSSILGTKKLNYDFLMLVRQQKYPQALALGKKILEQDPNNPSVKKFCDFIGSKSKQLQQMVQKQKEEAEYQSVDSDDQEQQDEPEDEQTDNNKKQSSSSESEEKQSDVEDEPEQQEQQPVKEKPKIQLKKCSLNPFPHICTRDHA